MGVPLLGQGIGMGRLERRSMCLGTLEIAGSPARRTPASNQLALWSSQLNHATGEAGSSVHKPHLVIHNTLQPPRMPMRSAIDRRPSFLPLSQNLGVFERLRQVVQLAVDNVLLLRERFGELDLVIVEEFGVGDDDQRD